MGILLKLFVFISCCVYVYTVLNFTEHLFGRKKNVSFRLVYIVCSGVLSIFSILSLNTLQIPFLYIIGWVIGFIPYHYLMNGPFQAHLLLAGSAIYDTLAFRGISLSIISLVRSDSLYNTFHNETLSMLSLGLTFVGTSLFWYFGNCKMYDFNHLSFAMKQKEQTIVIGIIGYVCIIALLISSFIYYRSDFTSDMTWYHLLTCIGITVMVYSLIVFWAENGFMQKSKDSYPLYKQQLEKQISAYAVQMEYIQQMRKLKHDWEALKLSLISEHMTSTDLNLQTICGEMDNSLKELSGNYKEYTANPLIQAILTHVQFLCLSQNIEFDAVVLLPETCPLTDLDLCRVFVNITNNALEANQRMLGEARKYIRIVTSTSCYWCTIVCENSFNGEFKKHGNSFESVKVDAHAHGFGIKNIEEIIESYGGFVKIDVNKQKKSFLIKLHIPV